MVICICRNVSERDIARAVADGCRSFQALQEKLDVGTCCGSCECAAREALAGHHRDARCEVAA